MYSCYGQVRRFIFGMESSAPYGRRVEKDPTIKWPCFSWKYNYNLWTKFVAFDKGSELTGRR